VKLRISLEGESYDVEVEILPETPAEPEESETLDVPASVLQPPPVEDTLPEDWICHSPIAGVVVSVFAFPGQRLRRDDPVLVIEAMKMQTTIGAPLDGTVDAVHVAPGQSVKPGQPLCTLV
jgi:biotin carboxyl carrier protein